MMKLERDSAQKPIMKLRKALKSLPSDPSSEEVHSLRTQTRRLEAIVEAFNLEQKRQTRQLLKTVTPVRKAAGDVRDMDVLVGNVLGLDHDRSNDSLVRLVEHLGEMRMESARELRHTVAGKRKDARRRLKKYSKLLVSQFPGRKREVESASPALTRLAAELAQWPQLDEENIHEFRIKVKQLRYMLQLSNEVDGKIIEELGELKDQVGDWHDWQELARIARGVLDAREDQTALKRIEEIGNRKYKSALAKANQVRAEYFQNGWMGSHRNGRASGSHPHKQGKRSAR
jgi:CHAD domain-containing protein